MHGTSRIHPAWVWAIAIAACCVMLRGIELAHLSRILGRLGLGCLLIPLPFLAAQLCETSTWTRVFRRLRVNVRFLELLRVRLASEAIAMSLPGGMLVAEGFKLSALPSQCGMSTRDAVCGLAVRKVELLLAQALYLASALLIGACWSEQRVPTLLWVLGGVVTLVLAALGFGLLGLVGASSSGARLVALAMRLPWQRVRNAVAGMRVATEDVERRLRAYFSRISSVSLLGFWATWCCEALETYLLLHLLGAPIAAANVILMEALVVFLRHAVAVIPAGLGLQDLGYRAVLQAYGVPAAAELALSLSLLKRTKELFWVAFGYSTFARITRARPVPALAR